MKKSIFLVIGLCILCAFIMFLSCDNDSSTGGNGGDAAHPSSLVGRWNATDTEVSMIVTTNSNQTAVDFISAGTGGLNLSGAFAGNLTYMAMAEENGENMALVANVPITELLDMADLKVRKKMNNPRSLMSELKTQTTYPLYVLYIASNQGTMLMAAASQSDTTTYAGTADGLTFDIPNFKLTANNLTLYDATIYPPAIVLVNGTLQNQVIDVPANTPTNVMTTPMPGDNNQTIVLEADGSFMSIWTYDSESDTSYANWAVTGKNILTIVEFDTILGEVQTYTTVVTYVLSGNDLIIDVEENACANDYDEECLTEIEEEFGLDEDSLVSATNLMEITFTKAGVAKL